MDWLAPSAAKLARAKKHRDCLNQENQAFLDSNPYTVSIHIDYEATEYEARVHENVAPDVIAWALTLGEALYNVRCALDYLAYTLTILETGQDPPPRATKLHFPIVTKSKNWRSAMSSAIPDIGQAVQDAIETLQPYHGADDRAVKNSVGEHPLELLRNLTKSDAQSVLTLLVAGAGEITFRSTTGTWNPFIDAEHDLVRTNALSVALSQSWDGALQEGAVIARGAFRITGPTPEVHMDAEVTPGVIVMYTARSGARLADDPVGGLNRILRFVEEEVFGRIGRAIGVVGGREESPNST